MSTVPSFSRVTLRTLSGLLVWGAHFLLSYIFAALACARRFFDLSWLGIGIVPWFIGVATLAAAFFTSLIAVESIRQARRAAPEGNASRFLHWMTAAIGLLALMAILWNALPVLIVPVCR